MESDQIVRIVAIAGMLLLVLGALSRRGLNLGRVVSLAVTWAIIFFAGFMLFQHRDQIAPIFADLRDRVDPAAPKVEGDTLRIAMSSDGHFWVRGKINGVDTRFLIDSGATMTALSQRAVRNGAVEVNEGGLPVLITTANGTISARRARIGTLDVGTIRAQDFAAVTAPEFGEMNVLGMNFLSSLKSWGVEGRTLILRP